MKIHATDVKIRWGLSSSCEGGDGGGLGEVWDKVVVAHKSEILPQQSRRIGSEIIFPAQAGNQICELHQQEIKENNMG